MYRFLLGVVRIFSRSAYERILSEEAECARASAKEAHKALMKQYEYMGSPVLRGPSRKAGERARNLARRAIDHKATMHAANIS